MNRIRAARQALGWTQADLARRASVAARTVHAIEQNRACRQETKRKLLIALAVPWSERAEYFPPRDSTRGLLRARTQKPAARETA